MCSNFTTLLKGKNLLSLIPLPPGLVFHLQWGTLKNMAGQRITVPFKHILQKWYLFQQFARVIY